MIQDECYLDNYTRLNSQQAHFLKLLLRFKCKENPTIPLKLWSRVGLVIDTDIEDVKYLLEINSQGFK